MAKHTCSIACVEDVEGVPFCKVKQQRMDVATAKRLSNPPVTSAAFKSEGHEFLVRDNEGNLREVFTLGEDTYMGSVRNSHKTTEGVRSTGRFFCVKRKDQDSLRRMVTSLGYKIVGE